MIAWTIAGSDSGGGAGIQADLQTFQAFGVHGCSAVTALTAQNTKAVTKVDLATPDMVEAQIDALTEDLPARAVKTGMLGSGEVISRVARKLSDIDGFLICDPVMVATSGGMLMEPEAKRVLMKELLPRVDLLTPNLVEAGELADISIGNEDDMIEAAARLLESGARSVLIKGGHGTGDFSQDYWSNGKQHFWLTSPRTETKHTHGSGCTLSAAIAACIALGYELADALVIAKAYISQGIRMGGKVGNGYGPVHRGGWPRSPRDIPWLTATAAWGRTRPIFPDCGPEPMGFYPIVDRAEWLERILPLGVRTVQLRVKDLMGDDLEGEIKKSITLAEKHRARLFINDHWELAVKHRAYGVHLGQEDLKTADPHVIAKAGLRLGVSTHSYEELARGLGINPSYLALGPIYATKTKEMPWKPQGLDRVRLWRDSIRQPLVAIGGIKLERAPGVIAAGADSIAVITALTKAPDHSAATLAWLDLFPKA